MSKDKENQYTDLDGNDFELRCGVLFSMKDGDLHEECYPAGPNIKGLIDLHHENKAQIKDLEERIAGVGGYLARQNSDATEIKRLERQGLEVGHWRSRLVTVIGWCKSKSFVESKYLLELLESPVKVITTTPAEIEE